MMLIDKADVERIGGPRYPFVQKWKFQAGEKVPEEYFRERDKEILAEGPFLLIVNEEEAWGGQNMDRMYRLAVRRADRVNRTLWNEYADLYVEDLGYTGRLVCLRFRSIIKSVAGAGGEWVPWREVYRWGEGSDLFWSSLFRHQALKGRGKGRTREVRLVSRG